MATTPLTRPLYMLGKWLSNFLVLMAMVAVLALAGLIIQLLQDENRQINLLAFLDPFFFLVMPLMTLVAAAAVLFEAIPFLQDGFGNTVYFFAFIMFVPLFMENETLNKYFAYEPTGLGLLSSEMGRAVSAIHPDYNGDFSLGGNSIQATEIFTWNGIYWIPDFIFARFSLIALALALTFLAALFFDRFDPSRTKPRRTKSSASDSVPGPASTSEALPIPHLTPLTSSPLGKKAANRYSFFTVLIVELKLLLKGQRWWWYAVTAGVIVACATSPSVITREIILPIAWVWPMLIWSAMGSREIHNNVQQLVFSSALPLWRQLPAQWLAGFIVTLILASGAVLRLAIDGDTIGFIALLSGALFIPSLALASGAWSGTSKLFEILYITAWYLGPLNKVTELDFIGSHSNGSPQFFIPFSIALIAFAILGRLRQLTNL
jgi:hypothetical protein